MTWLKRIVRRGPDNPVYSRVYQTAPQRAHTSSVHLRRYQDDFKATADFKFGSHNAYFISGIVDRLLEDADCSLRHALAHQNSSIIELLADISDVDGLK